MKKLMIVAAALAALNLPADITSANTVGYANLGLRNGSKMVGATFNVIGDKGMWLSKLTVNGYKDVSTFQSEGVLAQFHIVVLDSHGGTALDKDGNERAYDFYDVKEDGEWLGPVWYQGEETEIVDDDVVFEPGEGLWVGVDPIAYPTGEEKYTLIFPGIDEMTK